MEIITKMNRSSLQSPEFACKATAILWDNLSQNDYSTHFAKCAESYRLFGAYLTNGCPCCDHVDALRKDDVQAGYGCDTYCPMHGFWGECRQDSSCCECEQLGSVYEYWRRSVINCGQDSRNGARMVAQAAWHAFFYWKDMREMNTIW